MANGGRIDFTVGYKVDKTGLNEIKKELEQLKNLSLKDIMDMNPNITNINQARSELGKLQVDITKIEQAFKTAFDTTTGTTNIIKLNQNLKNLDIQRISQNFNALGLTGQQTFTKIATQAMTTNLKFKETNNLLNKIGTTLGNTIRWSISANAINAFTGAVQQAWGYVQHLDTSLNDIRIVTGKSAEEMSNFAKQANQAAQSLGQSTTAYTEASLIYYQQGLSDEETAARAETTLKAANVTGQTAKQVSEELTAVWNGYKVSAEETEKYVDKLAAVAATTASDLEELSTGMSKVASAANAMGVDIDQLNAQLATIVSVTRQAPESAGTALKTIYARIEDLKIGGEDESGVKLGDVSSTLDAVGVSIMDTEGNMRDLGEVIEEVASKWNTWTDAQQNAIAQAMAGKRQYNNLLALFDNWDMYNQALETSKNATGTLQKQQDIFMESTAAHIQQLKTQWEDLYDSLVDTDSVNNITDSFTFLLDKTTNFIDAIGGGEGVLLGFGAIATKVFSNQIAQGLESVISKFGNAKSNAAQLNAEIENTKIILANMGLNPKLVNDIALLKQDMQGYYDVMSQEEIKQSNSWIKQASDIALIKQGLDKALESAKKYTAEIAKVQGGRGYNKTTSGSVDRSNQIMNSDLSRVSNVDDTVNTEYEHLYGNLTKVTNKYNELTTAIDKYTAVIKDNNSTQQAQDKALEAINKTQKEYYSYIQQVGKYVKASGNKELEQEYEALRQQLLKLITAYKNYQTYQASATSGEKATKTKAVTTSLTQEKQALDNVTEGLRRVSEAHQQAFSDENRAKLENTTNAYRSQAEALKEMMSTFDTRQLIAGINSAVSGLSTLGMAYTSLSSLTKTWADETTSIGDKIAQTFISLGLVVPAVKTAIDGVNSATAIYNILSKAQLVVNDSLITAQAALGVARTLDVSLIEAAVAELAEEGVAIDAVTVQKELQTGAIDKNTLSLVLNTKAVQGNATAQELLGKNSAALSLQTKNVASGLSSLGSKIKTLGTSTEIAGVSVAALGTVLIALTAVAAACVIIYSNVKHAIEETAASSQAAADASKEQTEAFKEQKDTINEVVESYKQLKEEYDDTSTHDLRQATYELCKQHGLQDLAVKALISDYKELDSIIESAQAKINKDYGQKIQQEKTDIQSAVSSGIWRDLSGGERDQVFQGQKTIDVVGFWDLYSHEDKELVKQLEDLGIGTTGFGTSTHITLDSFVEAATEHYDELRKILEGSGTDVAKQLLEILDKQSENLNRYQTLLEEQRGQVADSYLPLAEKVDSTEEYEDVKSKIMGDTQLQETFTNIEGVLDEEALEAYVDQWMQSIDSIKEYAQNADLAGALVSKFGDSVTKEKIESQLEGLDDVTTNFIQDHINLLPAYADIDDFVEHFKDEIELLQQQDIVLHINTIFEGEKSGSFKDEDVTALYDETDFEAQSGISQQEFGGMNFEQQKAALLDYYTMAGQKEAEYRANVAQTAEEKNRQVEQEIEDLKLLQESYSADTLEKSTNGYLEHMLDRVNEVKTALGEGELSSDDFKAALDDLANVDSDEEIEKISKALYDAGITSKAQVAHLRNLIEAQEKFNAVTGDFNKEGKSYKGLLDDLGQQTKELDSIQDSTKDTIMDWSEAYKKAVDRMDDVNDGLDDIQSAYKSLTSIMEEYNETGVLSLDNLQTILEMDDSYLASLELENGQMSVNEQTLEALTMAKLDEAEATAVEEAMAKLLALQNQEVEATTEGVNVATQEVGVTVSNLITILQQGKQAWNDYWTAAANNGGYADKNWQTTTDSLYTRLSLIESVRDQVSSGGLSTTMNGTSSSSSGSSGSSSSSESKPDEEDKLKISDIDIYKGINEELDKIESVLGRIQTIDDHSWGKSAIDALTKESKILETQLKTYREKAEMQEGDLASQRASLEEQGITFSNDGSTMTNASEKLKSLYEEYNAMVDTYNAMSKTEQDEYKDTLEKKKDAIDDLEDAIDDYESLYSSYQDTLDSILEKQYEIIEKNVEAFNAEVEVHLELDEAKTAWNDFWYDVVKDVGDLDFGDRIAKSLDNLKVLVGYGNKKTSNSKVSELTSHLTDTTSEVWKQINNAENGGAGLFGSDTAKSKETLTDYRDKLISAVTEAKEAVDDIAQTYLDMLDDAQDKIDKQVKGWEAIEDHINHNVSLIKLISGEKAYDSLVKQYDSLYKNDINLINTQKQSKEFWAGEIKRYESLLANTEKGTKQWKTYTKALKTATDNYRDSIKNLDSALESAIQNVQSWRENQVNATFDKLDKAMSGGLGLDLVEEEWNLINNNASKYLDNVERAYSIEEYTLDLDEAANAIGLSAENQAKLNAFRDEELTKLREKNKLTQYDIDESRARLEIMRQEMALEEQKNNKSNMRLRRDSQGNYTYQYTGNDEDIEETEKAGLTARKEWYQLVKNRYTELSKDVIDIYKEQTTLLKEIDDAKLAGDTERENTLLEMYNQNEQYLVQIHEEAEKNKQDLASGTAQYFAEVENAQVLPQSAATVRTLIDQWAGSGKNSFLGAATNAINELDSTQTEYVNRTNKLLQEAGVDYKDLKEKGIDPTTDSLNDLVDSNEDFAEKLETVNEQLTTQEENLKAAEEAYNNLKTAAADAIEKANECLEKLSETSVKVKETVETNIQAVKNAASEAASAINSLSNSGSSGSSDGGSNGGSSSSSQKTYRLQSGLSYSGLFKIVDSNNNVVDENTIPELRKKWKGKVTGLKTGGYTGDWNDSSGKLAVLHKKELVLNESDTSNMLKAVDVVRDLVSNNSSADISGIAESLVRAGSMQAQMLAQVGSGLLATMSSIVNNATSQSYNNNMTVNADFSGVRSADAIYQALRELENYGSQVAYSDAPISNKAY